MNDEDEWDENVRNSKYPNAILIKKKNRKKYYCSSSAGDVVKSKLNLIRNVIIAVMFRYRVY